MEGQPTGVALTCASVASGSSPPLHSLQYSDFMCFVRSPHYCLGVVTKGGCRAASTARSSVGPVAEGGDEWLLIKMLLAFSVEATQKRTLHTRTRPHGGHGRQ